MSHTRRDFLSTTLATAGAVTVLPYAARGASHGRDTFATAGGGEIGVHPINHASFVLRTPAGVVHVDPAGEPYLYAGAPRPDLIIVTHQHGDHYRPETLEALAGEGVRLIVNPAVHAMLPDRLRSAAVAIGNGESTGHGALGVEAIPAYNLTEARKKFHPRGRDNGYVLTVDGFRIYVSGDTEDIPEMRALENIDLAFVCMNLPFTMDAKAAASAVAEFGPRHVYPYHYRGRDGGTQDPAAFAAMVGDAAEVKLVDWYTKRFG